LLVPSVSTNLRWWTMAMFTDNLCTRDSVKQTICLIFIFKLVKTPMLHWINTAAK
jgi:hypothetical protein